MSQSAKLLPRMKRRYLRSFPEEIYNLNDSSHIVRLLDALCKSGVGAAKRTLLVKRLQTELSCMRYDDLDGLYGDTFGLPRFTSEKYSYDVNSLLTYEQQNEVAIKDAAYRKRIFKYMSAFQYGGTKEGIGLAAEAALDVPCSVISCREYYQSRGIENGTSGIVMPLGDTGVADYNEYVVVAHTESDLTAEQVYGFYTAVNRIRPVNSRVTVRTVADLYSAAIAVNAKSDSVTADSVTASSEWWTVDRYVTGRSDWDTDRYDTWVEPNARKQAPSQVMSMSNGTSCDFTQLISSVSASTVHFGSYNSEMSSVFKSLNNSLGDSSAEYAVSRSSSCAVSSGVYGDGSLVIEGCYPIECAAEMTGYAMEDYRSYRFWSSAEAYSGEEWIEFDLSRIVPLTRVEMLLFAKPLKATLYASSSVDGEGGRVWSKVLGEDYAPLTYTIGSWGSETVAGGSVGAIFEFPVIQADALKIVFERLDVPYFKALGDGAYERKEFPYSIEVMDFSIGYSVNEPDGFVSASYTDKLGNLVELEQRSYSAETVIGDSANSFWVSKPNSTENAVEWLVFDIRDNGGASRFNRIAVDSVYDGFQMNIYSSDNGVEWTPIKTDGEIVYGGTYKVDGTTACFVKLEFTKLCPIPYTVIGDGIKVTESRFPKSAIKSSSNGYSFGTGATGADMLLGVKSDYSGTLVGIAQYKGYSASVVRTAYGSNASGEDMTITPVANASGSASAPVFFAGTVEHNYDKREVTLSSDIVYAVAIRSVSFSFEQGGTIFSLSDGWSVNMSDNSLLDTVDNWAIANGIATPTSNDVVGAIRTISMSSAIPFSAFSFSTEQKAAEEMFEHPSDMAQNWSGYNASVFSTTFGTSGTVLRADLNAGQSGIISTPVLCCAKAMANIKANVYSSAASEWAIEAKDSGGDEIFTSRFTIPQRKWTEIGTVFTPMAGGNWWNDDYAYRVKVPVKGIITAGESVYLPLKWGNPAADLGQFKLVWYDGSSNTVLPLDCTAASEVWFNCQQDLSDGQLASGSFDFSANEFVGAYFLYFNTGGTQTLQTDYKEMYSEEDVQSEGNIVTVDCELPDAGYVDCVYTGYASQGETKAYVFDYEDGAKEIEAYTYGGQLYVRVHDTDRVSAYVSKDKVFTAASTRLLVQWYGRGTDEVYVNGAVDASQTWRRKIRCWVKDTAGYRELACISNVYDEVEYSNGEY